MSAVGLRYDTYLFDWDGCILDTLGLWLHVYRELFRERALYITDDQIKNEVFGDWQAPARFGVTDLPTFTAELVRQVNEQLPGCQLATGAHTTIAKLFRQGKKLGIVSSSRRSSLMPLLAQHRLHTFFHVVVTADDVAHHKPDPESLFVALRALQSSASTSLMIGDSRKDILAAQNAGVDSALYYPKSHRGFYRETELFATMPTHVFELFMDLLTF